MSTLATRQTRAEVSAEAIGPYAGTRVMARLALRRDRVLIPVWAVAMAAMMLASAAAVEGLYPDETAIRAATATTNAQPSLVFMYGRIYDESSLAALATWKMLLTGAVVVALLAMSVVRRHTRADEEAGRLELVGAGVLGKRAVLVAALAVGSIAVLLTAALVGLAGIAGGLPVLGSLAFAATLAGVGLFFAGLTGLIAQLTQSARACAGAVGALLAVTYVLRGLADNARGGLVGSLSWLSPLGWATEVRPYADNRWWVLVLPVLATALLAVVAFALQQRRDVGEGIFPTRPGAATASSLLSTPLGLAWRLQRGALLGWAIGMLLGGLLIGSVASGVGGFLTPESEAMLEQMGGAGALRDVFLSAEFAVVAAIIAGYAVAAVLRLSAEESTGRAEPVLSSAVSRQRWLASHLIIALVGSAGLALLMGLGTAVGAGISSGDLAASMSDLVPAAAVQVPAIWVVAGLTAVLFGISRSLAAGGWVVLGASLVLGQFGSLFGLPDWLIQVSPFTHVPHLPAEDLRLLPLVVMTAVALGLAVAGGMAFRRRDLSA